MNKFLRLAAGVLCIVMLGLGVVFFDPSCLHIYPALFDPIRGESMAEILARHEHMKQFREASFRRIEDKWRIATEVIAGQRSLAEAIELFRDLDRQWPDMRAGAEIPELLWMSEDEWDGRAVIEQVRQVLAGRPDEASVVTNRLEEELQQLLTERKTRRPPTADPRTERSR
jgi:hypothetical protein